MPSYMLRRGRSSLVIVSVDLTCSALGPDARAFSAEVVTNTLVAHVYRQRPLELDQPIGVLVDTRSAAEELSLPGLVMAVNEAVETFAKVKSAKQVVQSSQKSFGTRCILVCLSRSIRTGGA